MDVSAMKLDSEKDFITGLQSDYMEDETRTDDFLKALGLKLEDNESTKKMSDNGSNENEPVTTEEENNEKKSNHVDNVSQSAENSNTETEVNPPSGHKVWVCKLCNKVYTRTQSYKQHMNTHQVQKVFQCKYCPNKYLIRDSFKTHLRRAHKAKIDDHDIVSMDCEETEISKENSFTCKVCDEVFTDIDVLEAHLNMHVQNLSPLISTNSKKKSPEKNKAATCPPPKPKQTEMEMRLRRKTGVQCEVCRMKFTVESELKKHLRETPFTCTMCQKHFANEVEFEKHRAGHTDKAGPYQCRLCPNKYTIRDSLKTHMRRRHPDEYKKMSDERKGKFSQVFRCDICGDTFSSPEALTKHVVESVYKCNLCKKHWSNARTFKYHMNKHSKEQQVFTCDFCPKTYLIEDSLKIHVRRNHREQAKQRDEDKLIQEGKRKPKGYKCCICSSSFYKNSSLRDHMSSHSNLPLIECQVCCLPFQSRDEMRSHIVKTHRRTDKDKYYACQVCNREFSRYLELGVHLREHRGGKPYRCELCARQFSARVHLEVHMKRRHNGEKPYVCDACDGTFFRRKFMMLHKCSG